MEFSVMGFVRTVGKSEIEREFRIQKVSVEDTSRGAN